MKPGGQPFALSCGRWNIGYGAGTTKGLPSEALTGPRERKGSPVIITSPEPAVYGYLLYFR
jgi:hypothetical protein